MSTMQALRSLNREQRNTFTAAFLGWTLDAFDYFLVVVVLRHVAKDLHSTLVVATIAVTLTLAMRPLGALIFGWCADRFGRRIPLMVDVGLYSLLELATAFSPNITVFIVLRVLFGVAMGGEWGLGASLAMETLPPKTRGFFSGLLQEGYMVGNLLAGVVFGVLFPLIGWRWMFVIGTVPALLILFIRSRVPESPVWLAGRERGHRREPLLPSIAANWKLFVYSVFFFAAFNYMSHATQDPYISMLLEGAHKLSPGIAGTMNTIAAIGAIVGGIVCGSLSQRFGRRNIMMAAGVAALFVVPLWAFGSTLPLLALGGFMMQLFVQGAWGVVPAYANEISPPEVRATFPGFTYQLGNLVAAPVLTIEGLLATRTFGTEQHPGYPVALAVFVASVLALMVVVTAIGYAVVPPEKRDAELAGAASAPA